MRWTLLAALLCVAACAPSAPAPEAGSQNGSHSAEPHAEPNADAPAEPDAAAEAESQPVSAADEAPSEAGAEGTRNQAALDALLQELGGQAAVTLPSGLAFREPLPTLVWLHGYNWNPSWVSSPDAQEFSNRFGVALIGIGATEERSPGRRFWTEDGEKDVQHAIEILDRVETVVSVQRDATVVMGFSQGGVMAARLLTWHAPRFRGAIILSPGLVGESFDGLAARQLENHRSVILYGEGENPAIVELSGRLEEELRSRGAAVELRPIEGMDTHSFPPDFAEMLPVWVNAILVAPPEGSGQPGAGE